MEYLKRESIEVGFHAPIWEIAIEEAGRLLMKGGKVKETYIQGMKDIIHQYGGYCVVANGLAIPHARPETGAIETGICFLKLDEPTFFPNQEYNPVRLVIAISATSNEDHMDLLKKISSFLSSPEALEEVKALNDVEEIYAYFQAL